jgi:hypothetical protein
MTFKRQKMTLLVNRKLGEGWGKGKGRGGQAKGIQGLGEDNGPLTSNCTHIGMNDKDGGRREERLVDEGKNERLTREFDKY